MKSTHEVISEINNLIEAADLSPDARRDTLWLSASELWEITFPTGITDADCQARWQVIRAECEEFGKERQAEIMNVLEWPASGKDPACLAQ